MDSYGAGAKYGRDPNLLRTDFSAAPFTATPIGYTGIHLRWSPPQSPTCTSLILVRSLSGIPMDQTDGTAFNISINQREFYDLDLNSGFVYYALFGFDSVNSTPTLPVWVRSGEVISLVPIQWDYANFYYNRLPLFYHSRDFLIVNSTNQTNFSTDVQPPLFRFLSMLGFQTDLLRTELESLLSVNDPLTCSGALLPLISQEFGMTWEPEMGMTQNRKLIANLVHLYKLKGSPLGISEFISALTSWAVNSVYIGPNRLLSLDDGIFQRGLGTWRLFPPPDWNSGAGRGYAPALDPTLFNLPSITTGNVTITQYADWSTIPAPRTTTDPGAWSGWTGGFVPPGYTKGAMEIFNSASTATVSLCSGYIPMSDFLSAPDVNGNQAGSITFRLLFFNQTAKTGRSVTVALYNENSATPLATHTATGTAGSWVKMETTASVTQASGNWLLPVVTVTSIGSNEGHAITLAAVYNETTGTSPQYDLPRDLKFIIEPQRLNLFGNPLRTGIYEVDGWQPYNVTKTSVFDGSSPLVQLSLDGESPSMNFRAPSEPNATSSMVVQVTSNQPIGTGFNPAGVVASFVVTATTETNSPGWFNSSISSADWFPGSTLQATGTKPWFPEPTGSTSVEGWFFQDETWNGSAWVQATDSTEFFASGTSITSGDWFVTTPLTSQSALVPIQAEPNTFYVFSIYASAWEVNTTPTMTMEFVWEMSDGSWSFGPSQSFTLTKAWARYDMDDVVPPGATSMYAVVTFPNSQAGDIFYLSSAMLETSTTPQNPSPYFDWQSVDPANTDYFKDVHGSSYYYQHFKVRSNRLSNLLPDWVPAGSTFTTLFSEEKI